MEIPTVLVPEPTRDNTSSAGVVINMIKTVGDSSHANVQVRNHVYEPGRQIEWAREGEVIYEGPFQAEMADYAIKITLSEKGVAGRIDNGFPFQGDSLAVEIKPPVARTDLRELERFIGKKLNNSPYLA